VQRLAWATDIHLNFLEPAQRRAFAEALIAAGADGVVISGDIAEARDFEELLDELAAVVARPIWFVLGNHDFYRGSVDAVRARATELTRRHPHLRWLPACGVVKLADDLALIGHDGWGDARLGNFAATPVQLSDFFVIRDLALVPPDARLARLRALGDEAAAYLEDAIGQALAWARRLLVVIHVPPFREACWFEGGISDDDWLPYFTCAAAGEALMRAMAGRPDARMTVVCGHTHGRGRADVLPNLVVLTGAAEYGKPAIERVLELSAL
jgi:hypothetical protein